MNKRRVVGILQELAEVNARASALQLELADAMTEEPTRKPRARRTVQPKTVPSPEAVAGVRRHLRTLGVPT